MLKKRKFLVGGLIILLAVVYLGYRGFASGSSFYYEVNELLAKGSEVVGQSTQLHGFVADGSIKQDLQTRSLTFTINDAKSNSSIKSVYKGSDIPDTFKPGAEIVIEGTLDASGVFQARKLMPKCPSRYAPG